VSDDDLRTQSCALMSRGSEGIPLWGVSFAAKDNVDVQSVPAMAGCPAYACSPEMDGAVIARRGHYLSARPTLTNLLTGKTGHAHRMVRRARF
jgi:allophanate hydrolase